MAAYVQRSAPYFFSSPPPVLASNWQPLGNEEGINRLEEEEQNWLQQNRQISSNNNKKQRLESISSNTEKHNVFGLKFWKWKISLKVPSLPYSSEQSHRAQHEQYGPHHCPLKKETKEDSIKGSKRDSQWEFFGFNINGKLQGGAKQAMRNRTRSLANIYYKPIDDQQEYEADTESEDETITFSNGENIYAEINDDDLQSPPKCKIFPNPIYEPYQGNDRVCMEPLPTIQHVTKIQVPPIPPKSPTRRNFLASKTDQPPVALLPPYPSSMAAKKKSRRKSLNIDKVDGKIKRRHSIKN